MLTRRNVFLTICLIVTIFCIWNYLLVDRRLVYNADRFHGHDIKNEMFFEGWYFKVALNDNSRTFAIIPGVLINEKQREAFLMVAHDNNSNFYRFPFESFKASTIDEPFSVEIFEEIDSNRKRFGHFSMNQLFLDLQPNENDDATATVKINLTMFNHVETKDFSWIFPGTMGPFSWFSFLQCYHHVLSMRFQIQGNLQIDSINLTDLNGIGYIEKDWGKMFPSIWIWGQANQWARSSTSNASLFFSFAIVPTGFTVDQPGFLIIFELNRNIYRFNSYLLSIVHELKVDNQTKTMSFTVYDVLFEHKLKVEAHFNDQEAGALLYGPRQGRMEKFVKEMLDQNIFFDVTFSAIEKSNENPTSENIFQQNGYEERLIFDGRAHHVALEINGNVTWLTEQFEQIHGNIYPWKFSLIRYFVRHSRIISFSLFTLFLLVILSRIFFFFAV